MAFLAGWLTQFGGVVTDNYTNQGEGQGGGRFNRASHCQFEETPTRPAFANAMAGQPPPFRGR